MGRGRTIFPIALAGSLALHAIGTGAYLEYWKISHPPAAPAPLEVAVKFVDPDLDEMGDARGTGIGSNSSPGQHPLEAREADEDQALLSRDPVGVGRIGGPPEQYQGPVGQGGGNPPAPAPSPPVAPTAVAQVTPPAASPPPPQVELPREDHATLPTPQPSVSPLVPQIKPQVVQTPPAPQQPNAPKPQTPVAAVPPVPASQNPARPGLQVSAADPLPPSESDSDPFSRIGSAVFHDGRLEVRKGRQVKTVRPQIGIAGVMDAIALNGPTIVLEIHIDPTGRVSDVEFARRSGSVALDEPTRDAVYQWWFEPAHDKSGKAIADVILFTIEFR
ncbi:MAG TPA: TonB family protein [Tepidisphaeraceae bacterium]|nr:TonB family protein [Tepidisphaeraceae bacterium]